MKKDIIFVILPGYIDWEGAYAAFAISTYGREKYRVRTASLTKDAVRSAGGFLTLPDYNVRDVPLDFAGIALIGGMGWFNNDPGGYEAIKPIIEAARSRNCPIGAIGAGVDSLGSTGILNTIPHTGNSALEIKSQSRDAYRGEALFRDDADVVQAGNIVTASSNAPVCFGVTFAALFDVHEDNLREGYEYQNVERKRRIVVLDGEDKH